MEECNMDKHREFCNCTYEPCSRKLKCCECLHYHRRNGERDPLMVTLPGPDYISDNARTQGERKQFLEDLLAFLTERFGRDSGILARSKNALINGNFDLWQRGTTITTSSGGAYVADRWRHELFGAGGSLTVSRQDFTLGQADVPGEPRHYYRANQTAAPATGSRPIEQRIEGVRSFAGQKITASFYAKADAAQQFEIEAAQNFGSGGLASAEVALAQNLSLTTSWQPYVATFDLALIAGKTIAWYDDYLGIRLNATVGTNATYTLDIARFQVEPGEGATPFDQRQPGEEYTLAARYYAKSYRLEVPPGTIPDLNGVAQYVVQNAGINWNAVSIFLPVKMRVIPTLVYYNPHAANANWRNVNKTADSGAGINFGSGEDRFGISNPQVAGDAIGDTMGIHWTADAEL